uniref:Uncharacterized protein n=1 Tax=Ciona savignyi TaxID=51511 RepID=H2ZNG8_CIOSA
MHECRGAQYHHQKLNSNFSILPTYIETMQCCISASADHIL